MADKEQREALQSFAGKGLECPRCKTGRKLFVSDTRGVNGAINRTRYCPDCGYKVITEEKPKYGRLQTG